MKVKAAVLRGYKEPMKVEDLELRKPCAGEVLVQLKASGICHSDLSVCQGALPFPVPCILGHEGAGVVVEIGEGVQTVKAGDRVILNNIPECGKCKQCKTPFSNLCVATGLTEQKGDNMFGSETSFKSPFTTPDGQPVGIMLGPATFATFCVVPDYWITPYDADISFEEAALIGCGVTTGFGCTKYATEVTPDSSVLVFGLGSIGLNIVQSAKIAGARHVIAVDINPKKESFAKTFGATHFVNPTDLGGQTLAERVKDIVGSNYVDFSFEATGSTQVLQTAVSLVHPFWGVCIAVGIAHHATESKFPASTFLIGRTLKGVYFGNAKPISAGKVILDLYKEKKLQIAPLITHRIPLADINKGFELLEKGEAVRAVIVYE